jgi:hypothetical protein
MVVERIACHMMGVPSLRERDCGCSSMVDSRLVAVRNMRQGTSQEVPIPRQWVKREFPVGVVVGSCSQVRYGRWCYGKGPGLV